MNITTATPVEIDTEINRLENELATVEAKADRELVTIRRVDEVKPGSYDAHYWTPAKREAAEKALEVLAGQRAELSAALVPLYARYDAERWNRYYLVANTGGHVHTSTRCRTCFDTTQFIWLTEESAKTHEDVTGRAGEISCAECFPNLPAEIMKRKTRIEDPAKRKTRIEREAKKAAALAKKIANGLTADGSPLRIEWVTGGYVKSVDEQGRMIKTWTEGAALDHEEFKTERAASMYYVDAFSWGRPPSGAKREALEKIVEAMATKHGKTVDEVRAELDAKVAAKIKRLGV